MHVHLHASLRTHLVKDPLGKKLVEEERPLRSQGVLLGQRLDGRAAHGWFCLEKRQGAAPVYAVADGALCRG